MMQLKLAGANAFQAASQAGKGWAVKLKNADSVMAPVFMACAIAEMRALLTDEAMSVVAQLAGSSLGFRTDQQYSLSKLRDVVIAAWLSEINIVGNELNVIAGDLFIAKNGWKRKLNEAGFRRVDPNIGRPEDIREGSPNPKGNKKISAMFSASASCQKGGETFQVTALKTTDADYRIEVDAYGSSLMDVQTQLRGKAEARILRKLWYYVADEPEVDSDEPAASVIVVESQKIEEQPAATVTVEPVKVIEQPSQQNGADAWDGTWREYAKQHGNNAAGVAIARAMRQAPSIELLQAAAIEADAAKAQKDIDQRTYDKLKHYLVFLEAQFTAQPAGVA